jgi:hypothetical protein
MHKYDLGMNCSSAQANLVVGEVAKEIHVASKEVQSRFALFSSTVAAQICKQ